MPEERLDTSRRPPNERKFPITASHEPYTEPEPILDPSCGFEQMDRGEGMGVDDEKTYYHTER